MRTMTTRCSESRSSETVTRGWKSLTTLTFHKLRPLKWEVSVVASAPPWAVAHPTSSHHMTIAPSNRKPLRTVLQKLKSRSPKRDNVLALRNTRRKSPRMKIPSPWRRPTQCSRTDDERLRSPLKRPSSNGTKIGMTPWSKPSNLQSHSRGEGKKEERAWQDDDAREQYLDRDWRWSVQCH